MALSDYLRNAVGGAYAAGSVVNDGGTVVKAGNVAAGDPITKALGTDELADDFGKSVGSKVVASLLAADLVGVSGAKVGTVVDGETVLGFNANATQWIMQGGNVTTTIGGSANTVLAGGARDHDGQQNAFDTEVNRLVIDTELVGASGFDVFARPSTDIVPGRTNAGGGNPSVFINPADGTPAVRSEIAPSQAVPGELTYFYGSGAQPSTDDYKAKNANE
tara:strand:- start:261 stop:920 length:660 start_codon:yes stop_codon:yes gene_type:complete